ncbi:hypothetical protein B0H16DRAFT_1719207 [Mycena metata]|uniref:Glutamate carboxypeptidase n=1 Tax=Mycena metata TaxID=1033252 RepID=A0AAD7JGN4_9AGAR|nr:hypothetical protein B0H16DRAFT_1719207 [Mycena metata]
MPAPAELLSWVDASKDAFIAQMSDWLNVDLNKVGVETKQVDLGNHVMYGQTMPLPNAIPGKIGDDKNKKTVLIYGHFDVQSASLSDGWASEPFVLTMLPDGRLVGRGSSDDKGPVLGWLAVLQWHHETQTPLPVNLRFCFEGMEENGSEGLDELVERERDGWFGGADCMCTSDNYWPNTRTPALTYGLRGLVYFKINVSGPGRDLHSGAYSSLRFLRHLFSTFISFILRFCLVPTWSRAFDSAGAAYHRDASPVAFVRRLRVHAVRTRAFRSCTLQRPNPRAFSLFCLAPGSGWLRASCAAVRVRFFDLFDIVSTGGARSCLFAPRRGAALVVRRRKEDTGIVLACPRCLSGRVAVSAHRASRQMRISHRVRCTPSSRCA